LPGNSSIVHQHCIIDHTQRESDCTTERSGAEFGVRFVGDTCEHNLRLIGIIYEQQMARRIHVDSSGRAASGFHSSWNLDESHIFVFFRIDVDVMFRRHRSAEQLERSFVR
jgi:hypothetical protein